MIVNRNPYPHLIHENYMSDNDFEKCKSSISFEEIKAYCDDPQSFEHENAQHGNYSMPTDLTQTAKWLEDYFINEQTINTITKTLYGKILVPDHCYVNLHWDSTDTSLGIHNDQKKYKWLVTGQLYIEGNEKDGVILQDDNLNEITQIPLKPNLFYAMATSMYSWHHVKHIRQDKISILVRFGRKQITTVTNRDDTCDYAILIKNDGHYDGHYSKLGMRMANMTEAWLSNQGYKNIHISDWKNEENFNKIHEHCNKNYSKVILVPSGYLGGKNLLLETIDDTDIEKITKDNVDQLVEIIFNRSNYNNTRLRAGEIILKSFNSLERFSDLKNNS